MNNNNPFHAHYNPDDSEIAYVETAAEKARIADHAFRTEQDRHSIALMVIEDAYTDAFRALWAELEELDFVMEDPRYQQLLGDRAAAVDAENKAFAAHWELINRHVSYIPDLAIWYHAHGRPEWGRVVVKG